VRFRVGLADWVDTTGLTLRLQIGQAGGAAAVDRVFPVSARSFEIWAPVLSAGALAGDPYAPGPEGNARAKGSPAGRPIKPAHKIIDYAVYVFRVEGSDQLGAPEPGNQNTYHIFSGDTVYAPRAAWVAKEHCLPDFIRERAEPVAERFFERYERPIALQDGLAAGDITTTNPMWAVDFVPTVGLCSYWPSGGGDLVNNLSLSIGLAGRKWVMGAGDIAVAGTLPTASTLFWPQHEAGVSDDAVPPTPIAEVVRAASGTVYAVAGSNPPEPITKQMIISQCVGSAWVEFMPCQSGLVWLLSYGDGLQLLSGCAKEGCNWGTTTWRYFGKPHIRQAKTWIWKPPLYDFVKTVAIQERVAADFQFSGNPSMEEGGFLGWSSSDLTYAVWSDALDEWYWRYYSDRRTDAGEIDVNTAPAWRQMRPRYVLLWYKNRNASPVCGGGV